MKRKFNLGKVLGRKNIFLAVLSLILVFMMTVTATSSWIEEISQVEFSSTDGQETPLHVGSKILKSDAVMKSGNQSADTIDLDDYFYKSGDMHLSPCFSDGENFYFPNKSGGGYRIGNKDDANVNYLSATFKIISEGAGTAYWFEKSGENNDTPYVNFKKDSGVKDEHGNPIYNDLTNTGLEQYLRLSITVDGATAVYALNADGNYYTLNNDSPSPVTGRAFEQYTYYKEDFSDSSPEGYYKNAANVTNKPNQGGGDNLNGNTLFNVNKYDATNKTGVKTVTVKMWLEQKTNQDGELDNTFVSGADIASININLVSSWAKTRRVYVKDSTVHQSTYSSAKWLSNENAKLYFAVKNNMTNAHYEMVRIGSSDYYYADIPAVYNNADAILFRCNNAWSAGSQSVTYNGVTVSYWDKWETIFPDTFHSETYTVYSTDFGTWEEDSKVKCVYFINSQKYTNQFTNIYDYMWDSASVYGTDINHKVVKNADWPGIVMTTKMYATTGSSNQNLDVYAFFYNSDYDRIIFSDGLTKTNKNYEFQTQDLWLSSTEEGKTFDMATLTWFNTYPGDTSHWSSYLPTYTGNSTYLYGNFVTDNQWRKYRFAYGGQYGSTNNNAFNTTSTSHLLSKVYIKAAGSYEFVVYYNGTCYKTYKENVNLYKDGTITLYPEGGNNTYNVYAKDLKDDTVYRFYMDNASSSSVTIRLYEGEN